MYELMNLFKGWLLPEVLIGPQIVDLSISHHGLISEGSTTTAVKAGGVKPIQSLPNFWWGIILLQVTL